MRKAVMFDLDGTVLDSQCGVFRSIDYAMGKLQLTPPPMDERLAFLGPPIQDGFSEVCHVPTELLSAAIGYYREYYNRQGKFEAAIYDGVVELLKALRENGCYCYITTSKPRVFAEQILDHFGILTLFDGVYGAELDGKYSKKREVLQLCLQEQDLKLSDVVLVGDRCFDAQGARELGMECVGILYGYGSRKELVDAGATYIVDTATALQQFLLNL